MMYGQRRGEIGFTISHVKGYVRPILWLEQGNRLYKVGSFMSDKSAEDFWKVLNYVENGSNYDEAFAIFKRLDKGNKA